MVDLSEITLETLGGGALSEQFAHEFGKVLENIVDPNTDPEAVRKVAIEVAIKPSANRESATTTVKVTSELAGLRPVASPIWIIG